ncbi:hypothetical protein BDW69DRAFT_157185 [Aspergillus filifer]
MRKLSHVCEILLSRLTSESASNFRVTCCAISMRPAFYYVHRIDKRLCRQALFPFVVFSKWLFRVAVKHIIDGRSRTALRPTASKGPASPSSMR